LKYRHYTNNGVLSVIAFYEKVIKVKADVAALIAFHLHNPPVVTWGAVKGVPQGTFVWTLNSSARRFILSGFGVQFVLAASELLSSNHFRSFAEVHGSALRTFAFLKVLPATTTPTRLLSALSRSHIGPGARWGSILNQALSQK